MKIIDFFKRLFKRKPKESKIIIINVETKTTMYSPMVRIPKAGSQATRQDISKFMKHGRQSPTYRKSIKAKVNPEDDEDD